MNVMTGVGANRTGLLSPTPQQRLDAKMEASSMARANALGRLPRAFVELMTKQSSGATGATGSGVTGPALAEEELDRDAFLNLLMTQVQNQDPLEPVDNTDMIAQLAQFSSLEQMENLNSSFEQLSSTMAQQNFLSASSLVGRSVSAMSPEGELIEGPVEAVSMVDGKPRVRVGEWSIGLEAIQQVQ